MSATTTHETSEKWYTRPVFSVSAMDRALHHYCELLGFTRGWSYEEAGEVTVTQVARGDLELILTSNLDRTGQGRLFVSLTGPEMADLERIIAERRIAADNIHWGYPSLRIRDPDGNELIFPREASA